MLIDLLLQAGHLGLIILVFRVEFGEGVDVGLIFLSNFDVGAWDLLHL